MATSPLEDAAIRTRGLTRIFGEHRAVDGVDLEVKRGEIFGLLGPNGAGKTTTINMLTTLLKPSSGEAYVNGFDVSTQAAGVRQSVGLVFQEPSIDTLLTARENLVLHGRLYGVPPKDVAARVDELLKLVELDARADDRTRTFSGGMKRRLEIARGLLHRPTVLFLDEPTLGLDPQAREHIWTYLRELRRDYGTTILLTTHYMEEADQLCDRVAIIDHGKIVALDTPRALKDSIGGDVVRLRIAKPDLDTLAKLAFVDKVEAVGNEVHLTIQDAPANLAKLIQAAGEVEGVEVRRPTLEDVFIKFTGHELRDDSGAGEGFADQFFRHTQGGNDR